MQCKTNSHPANSIRHAYSRYEYVRANTIGAVTVSPYWLKFTALRLIVVTMPIQKAVASGKGNNEYYRRRTRSNLKQPPIATMPYRIWITVSFLTPLFFRYHLPLSLHLRIRRLILSSFHILQNACKREKAECHMWYFLQNRKILRKTKSGLCHYFADKQKKLIVWIVASVAELKLIRRNYFCKELSR